MSLRHAPTLNSIAVLIYCGLVGLAFLVTVLIPLCLIRAVLLYLLLRPSYESLEFVDTLLIFKSGLWYCLIIAAAGFLYIGRLDTMTKHPFKPGKGDVVAYRELFWYQMKHHAAAVLLASSVSFTAYAMYYLRINQNPTPNFVGGADGQLGSRMSLVFVVAWCLYWIGRTLYWEWLMLKLPDAPEGILRGRRVVRAYEIEEMIVDDTDFDDDDDDDDGRQVIG